MTSFLRIYADRDGESHFEDVALKFEQTDLVPPAPPVFMTTLAASDRYGFELVHPGWHGDAHPVPQRLLAVYLSGTGTMEASDGEVRVLVPGTILLAEDTTGKGHVSRVTGGEDMLVLILMLP
ncbi:MAG: cupin domain-containing protein [Actinomycetota bacterium]